MIKDCELNPAPASVAMFVGVLCATVVQSVAVPRKYNGHRLIF